MEIFRVGGYVRDKLLGLTPRDCDYVVVGSSIKEMLKLGYIQVGKHFPVFLHPQTKEEYALARTEQKKGIGHTGFNIESSKNVTLEEDLLRRDLTINAIAEGLSGKLIDPVNGINDLKKGILRHISPAFQDDPLRILRVARFSARFNFIVAPETLNLLKKMAIRHEITTLSRERIFNEVEKALEAKYSNNFFQILQLTNNLEITFPRLAKNLMAKNNFYTFLDVLSHGSDIWQKYTVLASYLDEEKQSQAELTNRIETQKYIAITQKLQNNLSQELSNQQILDLLKKTNALRNSLFFEKVTKNYEWWLTLSKASNAYYTKINLSLISQSLKNLQTLPENFFQTQMANANIAKEVHDWQLDTIKQVRKRFIM